MKFPPKKIRIIEIPGHYFISNKETRFLISINKSNKKL